jgi:HEAT repeat protein
MVFGRVKVCFGLGSILLTGVIVWLALRAGDSDPIVEGKRLSHWLEGYQKGGERLPRDKADQIITSAGTNAIPTLLRLLRKHDSAAKQKLMQLTKRQRLLSLRLIPAYQLQYQAALGFARLGSAASNALPDLIKIYDENISVSSRYWTINALGSVGASCSNAVPFLVKTLSNTNMGVRLSCIQSLHMIRAAPELSVPALIKTLNDQQGMVRYTAVLALGAFEEGAKPAMPFLTNLLSDPDRNVRQGAITVLGRLQQYKP